MGAVSVKTLPHRADQILIASALASAQPKNLPILPKAKGKELIHFDEISAQIAFKRTTG